VTEFPAAADRIVRIKYADDDACDSAFDDSLGAPDLGGCFAQYMVPAS
jgi:hypothetical protein